MSIYTSLPSKEIHSIDVPEPIRPSVDFRYNFFVASEGADELDVTTAPFEKKSVDDFDSSFEKFANTRLARYVKVAWDMPSATRTRSFPRGIISTNMDKIVNENDLSSNDFFSILFNDPDLAEKMHGFVSSSLSLQTLGSSDVGRSGRKLAHRSADLVTSNANFNIITAGLQQLQQEFGVSFFNANGVELKDNAWNDLAQLGVLVQLNSKLAQGMIENCAADPHSPYTSELDSLKKTTARLNTFMKQKAITGLSENDFRSYVPYIDIQTGPVSLSNLQTADIVGYIIDKVEYLLDGTVKAHPPFVVENSETRSIIDIRTRYGATYAYTVRAVARISTPAIDDSNGDVSLISFLVSSKPSGKAVVRCIELIAPPVPNDINFTWNYETEKLLVHWSHPINSQRDIKEFQVFRRNSVDEPFQLLKVFRFNDAQVQNVLTVHYSEPDIDLASVEITATPVSLYIDDEFTKNSSFIYTVVCVDAHGLCSNYGEQFKLGFDIFKNKLTKELISHSGAPKPYPNMYLEADLFQDTIKVSGASSKRLRVYLNPEFYEVVDNNGKTTEVLSTTQRGGSYVLQFINTDIQKMTRVEITVDDQNNTRRKGTSA